MRNTFFVVLTVLVVSAFVLSGCERKEPEVQPQVEKEVKTEVKAETNPEAEKAALEAARIWLELIDGGKYSEGWDESVGHLKALVSKEDWSKRLQGARQPLGKMISREAKSTHYTMPAPGAPDGQYVIIQYETSFENKKTAVETVMPMVDKDGKWRVSGYYIR